MSFVADFALDADEQEDVIRAKPHIEYDMELIGFSVAVYPSGAKSWTEPAFPARGPIPPAITAAQWLEEEPDDAQGEREARIG